MIFLVLVGSKMKNPCDFFLFEASLIHSWKEYLIRNRICPIFIGHLYILQIRMKTGSKLQKCRYFRSRTLAAILMKLNTSIGIFITNHLEQFSGTVINTVVICRPEFKFWFVNWSVIIVKTQMFDI